MAPAILKHQHSADYRCLTPAARLDRSYHDLACAVKAAIQVKRRPLPNAPGRDVFGSSCYCGCRDYGTST